MGEHGWSRFILEFLDSILEDRLMFHHRIQSLVGIVACVVAVAYVTSAEGYGGHHGGHHGGFHGGHFGGYGGHFGHGGFYGGYRGGHYSSFHGGGHGGRIGYGYSPYVYSSGNNYRGHGGELYVESEGIPPGSPIASSSLTSPKGDGWTLLADGRSAAALSVFANQAERDPTNSVPKIGYSLAMAARGDLSGGVRAMRRACRIDPDSMHNLKLDARLQPTLDRLADRYQVRMNTRDRTDSAFMLAALKYLRQDRQGAQAAAEIAATHGDRSESLAHLRQIIAQMPDESLPKEPAVES